MKKLGFVKEKIKNLDDDLDAVLVINGIEHPLTDIVFDPDGLRFVAQPPVGSIEVYGVTKQAIAPLHWQGLDQLIRDNGVTRMIHSVKTAREMTGWGLAEAHRYCKKILGIET